ncbi:MAG: AAA family ATPase [Mycobacterium sp.]
MKLHRLVLTNYRGIAHREIDFPDRGVVVVSGPNEIGKSSMLEALDLLLESRDRSARKDVKQVQPTHADVGAEVTAEISTGPYRFVYHKRFHKKPQTELSVLAPHREQLTGDPAHERVAAMLAETVDTGLWRALRVLQAASTDAVDLSGCDALSRALDAAAGDTATLTGTEPQLIERIDAEFADYFTPTGRATGGWAAATKRLTDAETEVTRCAAEVAEVDVRVIRHAALTEELAGLHRQRDTISARCTAARAAADKVAELNEQLRRAEFQATAAVATSCASTAAHTERARLGEEVDARTAVLAALEAEVAQAVEAQAAAGELAVAAETAVEQAIQVLTTAAERVDAARQIVGRLADREEAQRLTTRLGSIDTAQGDLDRVSAELSGITMTEPVLHRIEQAAAGVDRSEAALTAISTTLEFTAATDIELFDGDERVSLLAGESWSTTATEVEVAGVLTIRANPGTTARDAQTTHAAAQQGLTAALAAAGVADLAAARAVERRRRELQTNRDQLVATLSGLCGGEAVDQLRSRLAPLLVGQEELGAAIDSASARAGLEAAEAAHSQALEARDTHHRAAVVAAGHLTETSTWATIAANKVTGQRAELTADTDRLASQRLVLTDEALAASAVVDEQAAQVVEQRVTELAENLTAVGPDAVAVELAEATAASDTLRTRYEEADRALNGVTVQLAVLGTEGRHSKFDTAAVDREHAAAEHARVGRRARAVRLLREVMGRHRDATRLRYVEPFRAEIERLGRPVFGPGFEVEVDSQLCIANRTLDGRTVPYESLSGGAKEQLGILVRLAGAGLVAKEDTVPVLIDDALGFTDSGRLASMGEVFDAVGAHGQVIVLTCTPERYDSVEGAHRIDLSV